MMFHVAVPYWCFVRSAHYSRVTILILLCQVICGAELPLGTTFEARLSTPTGSRISQTGDPIAGITIAPVVLRGQILVPQGSKIRGFVENVTKFGLGIKQVTAGIHFRFDVLQLPNREAISIQTELLEVETAKERVDVGGTARGIHPAASLSSVLSLFTLPLLFVAPTIGVPVYAAKSIIAPSANPEIYFPPGTEVILRLTASVEVSPGKERPIGIISLSPGERSAVRRLLKGFPQQARMGKHPSDLINLVFFGSDEEIDRAFHAVGWLEAQSKSPLSLYRMYNALTRRIGYKTAPMNALTLNGVPSYFVYQKSLDTVEKRHHIRLWRDPQEANVWLGTAAQDIGFRFRHAHWTHSTAPNIDSERAKVVNDLVYTGCVQAGGLVSRDSPTLVQRPEGGRSVLTDMDVAVVQLSECNDPTTMSGIDPVSRVVPRHRLWGGLTSLQTDLRLNIVFTTYNTLKLVSERHALQPLRKVPSSDVDPTALDWLNSLEIQEPSHPVFASNR
jgi:LssY C-terminus